MTKPEKMLRHVRVELARDHEFPSGSNQHGYEFIAPLDKDGHIDLLGPSLCHDGRCDFPCHRHHVCRYPRRDGMQAVCMHGCSDEDMASPDRVVEEDHSSSLAKHKVLFIRRADDAIVHHCKIRSLDTRAEGAGGRTAGCQTGRGC